ncbi:unnamed protein product [Amoebophrya sp. A25]|nr:unnamed protein product [Amoebophrya sp. A25]|eukprot:GSA25T00022320001.1
MSEYRTTSALHVHSEAYHVLSMLCVLVLSVSSSLFVFLFYFHLYYLWMVVVVFITTFIYK